MKAGQITWALEIMQAYVGNSGSMSNQAPKDVNRIESETVQYSTSADELDARMLFHVCCIEIVLLCAAMDKLRAPTCSLSFFFRGYIS